MKKYAGLSFKDRKHSCRYRESKCVLCGKRVMTPKNSHDVALCIGCAPDRREEERREVVREKIRGQIMATRRY